MNIGTFKELGEAVRCLPCMRAAVIAPYGEDLQFAFRTVAKDGIAHPIYIGDRDQAVSLMKGLRDEECGMVHCTDEMEACQRAVKMVVDGEADFLVKGLVPTSSVIKAILASSLRPKGELLTHVAAIENPTIGRLMLAADGGALTEPTFDQYEWIIQHTVDVAHALGRSPAKIAVVSSVETKTDKITFTGVAERIVEEMSFQDAIVGGPMGLDLAWSVVSAEKKGYSHPVAGCADGIVGGSIDVVNGWVKGITIGPACSWGGVLLGGKKAPPTALDSRGNYDPMTTVYSIMLARLMVEFYAQQAKAV